MSDAAKLDALKALLDEGDDECRVLSDEVLQTLLDGADGRLYQAAYAGALRKSRMDSIRLPDGMSLMSNHEYWLRMAAMYRPNVGGIAPRADDRRRTHDCQS